MNVQWFARNKILIVEDSPELASIYSRILSHHGATTMIACTMRDGLAKYFAFEPDLLLCDLSMNHGSGFDFIRAVRAMESGTSRRVAAVAVTGHSDPESVAMAIREGFDEFVVKPVFPEQLLSLVDRFVPANSRSEAGA